MIFNDRPTFIEDMQEVSDPKITELSIKGKTKNLHLLSAFPDVKKLWVTTVNQKEFELIISLVHPKFLWVYEMRVEDLSSLAHLHELEELEMCWNTKATRLWDMSQNVSLKVLSIEDFSKLSSIRPLEDCLSLEILELSGGIWNAFKIDTLEPLKNLLKLKQLGLSNIKVSDQSLEPISNLIHLENLVVSNQFPTEEYAKLSVKLPNTKCGYFKPYIVLNQPIEDKDVMVIGKGKPFLNSKTDSAKLKKYEEQFALLQNKYSKR